MASISSFSYTLAIGQNAVVCLAEIDKDFRIIAVGEFLKETAKFDMDSSISKPTPCTNLPSITLMFMIRWKVYSFDTVISISVKSEEREDKLISLLRHSN